MRIGLGMLSALVAGFAVLVATPPASAQVTAGAACRDLEAHVGGGRVNIVDFRRAAGGADSPFVFRLAFKSFESLPQDGFFGRITKGRMTFSYPRQNNPEVPYDAQASEADRFRHGPPYGDTVDYQAREIACNVFELHWKEPKRGDTVTHVEDFGRQQVCTNIANINRVPIPAAFDPLDVGRQLDNPDFFADGNPVTSPDFPFVSLCGTMRQTLTSEKVWENELHMLVYEDPS